LTGVSDTYYLLHRHFHARCTWSGSNCGHCIEHTYKVVLTCIVCSCCWLLLSVQRTAF